MNTNLKALNTFLHNSHYFYTISENMDSVYSYVSPNYNKNFGAGRESLFGQKFSVTLHPEDIEVCSATGYRCMQNPDRLIPVTLRKHDGKGGFVTTHWEMQAMMSPDNTPISIVLAIMIPN